MNYDSPDSGAGDVVTLRAFLQQAVDHYPRLVAFSFMLEWPYHQTVNDYRSLILRFHTEVWLRIGEYSRQRQQARRHSPPTILRWLWESVSVPECKMVLLLNLDTLGAWCNEVVQQEVSGILREAWHTVTHADNNVACILAFTISRSEKGTFTVPFSQLQTRVNGMASPTMTARTGVVCP